MIRKGKALTRASTFSSSPCISISNRNILPTLESAPSSTSTSARRRKLNTRSQDSNFSLAISVRYATHAYTLARLSALICCVLRQTTPITSPSPPKTTSELAPSRILPTATEQPPEKENAPCPSFRPSIHAHVTPLMYTRARPSVCPASTESVVAVVVFFGKVIDRPSSRMFPLFRSLSAPRWGRNF